VSERQYRLIGCACIRHLWYLARHDGRVIVDLVERYIDGQAGVADFDALFDRWLAEGAPTPADADVSDEEWFPPYFGARFFLSTVVMFLDGALYNSASRSLEQDRKTIRDQIIQAMDYAVIAAGKAALTKEDPTEKTELRAARAERRIQSDLVRDIAGNPFR